MNRVWYASVATLALGFAGAIAFSAATLADEPKEEEVKYSLEDVMKQGMKGGLVAKVASGQASDEEKATLLHMFKDMAKQKPHKGEAESWKKFNDELTAAAEDAVAGKPDAGSRLKQAANCKACHEVHK